MRCFFPFMVFHIFFLKILICLRKTSNNPKDTVLYVFCNGYNML